MKDLSDWRHPLGLHVLLVTARQSKQPYPMHLL